MSWGTALLLTNSPNQHHLQFQPGTDGAVFSGNRGVNWSANWGQPSPASIERNKGYRAGAFYSVGMKSTPGNAYLIGGTQGFGVLKLTDSGLDGGTFIIKDFSDWSASFVDENSSATQVLGTNYYYPGYYLSDGANYTYLTSTNGISSNASDYDSQTKTLYAYDYVNNAHSIRKIAGIGSTVNSTNIALSSLTTTPSFFKLSADKQALFIGTSGSQLYKITNLSQASPSAILLSNNAFPQYTTVSCIDVGADNNELLVTLSNYGVQSVWYTNNGGVSWVGKDQSNFGLPDVPVRTALFNPQNRKQILLGTDAGIWSTDEITAVNPGWTYTGAGIGAFRVNQLRYRASDGRVAAATFGRGIWQTDALAVPYTPSTITLTGVSNATLCAGSTVVVSYSVSGPAFTGTPTVEVWVSDANGSFANQKKIGSGTSNPISVTLPTSNALPYGTNYQFKVVASAQDIESSAVGPVAIGNLGSASAWDRLSYGSNGICDGSQATLHVVARDLNYTNTIAGGYQWSFNGTPISGATSQTITARQLGAYQATVQQAGCTIQSSSYNLYAINSSSSTVFSTYIVSSGNGQPQCSGTQQLLRSGYVGEGATFQWTRDGADIAGATTESLTATQTGSYSFRVSDGCMAIAQAKQLTFGQSLNAVIRLFSDNDSLLCTTLPIYSLGMTADFSASNGYFVQWYRDGILLAGATTNTYFASQPGIYSIFLQQGNCQTRSNALTISPTDQIKVSIRHSYTEQSACSGETRYLSAYPTFNGSYQWQRDGVAIPGATSSQYAATLTGTYTVRFQRGNCSATSAPVSFTFGSSIRPKLSLTETCSDAGLTPNTNSIQYNISGYQYQWFRNGTLISGATGANYYTSQPNRSGVYYVRVINGSCTGQSKDVYVGDGNTKTVKPVVDVYPSARQLCTGNSVRLSVNTYRGNLQWKRNGVVIPSQTQSSFYATESGHFTAFVQDGTCIAESDPIEVKIGETTTAALNGNALISSGTSTLLPVTFTGPAPWSASLTTGQSVTATYQNPAFITVSPTSSTTYQLASVVNACGTGTVTGQVSISVGTGSADVSANMTVSNRTPRVGELVAFTVLLSNAGPQESVRVRANCVLPPGLEFVDAPSIGLSYANGTVLADVGTIGIDGSIGFQFRARAIQTGVFITALQITGTQTPDPDSQPNSGTADGQDDVATVDLRTADGPGPLLASANPDQIPLPKVSGNQPITDVNTADLSMGMQVNKLTPVVNELVTTSVTVSNRGGSTAASVVVQVVLPNGTFSPQSPAGWILVSSQTYKRYINALPAGQSATVSLLWQPAGTGMVKAQILDADVADPDSTPGNGYDNGEDDTTSITLQVR